MSNANTIPKYIWSYWDSPELPDLIALCHESWKKNNRDYEINLLNKYTWRNFVKDIDLSILKFNDSPQRFSDFLRLHLLKQYGGVWMDASMLCFSPLSNWLDPIVLERKPELVGFVISGQTTDWKYPVIESWFMAAPLNSTLISEYYDEFIHKFNSFNSIPEYISYLKGLNVNFHNIGANEYLALYLSFQKVLQMSPNKSRFRIKTISAEDDKLGPMYYMVLPNDGINEDISSLMKICTMDKARTALVKMRSNERNEIENKPQLSCVLKLQL